MSEQSLLLIALAASIAIAAVLAYAYRRDRRSARVLVSTAEQIAAGRHDSRAPQLGGRASRRLARALNEVAATMSDRLEQTDADREQLMSLVDNMVDGVIAIDAVERIVVLNPAAAELYEVDTRTSIGRPVWEVLRDQPTREALRHAVREDAGASASTELADELTVRAIEVQARPLGTGAVRGAFAIARDVTDAQKVEKVRRDFVANVSHELKTPITAIRALLDTVGDPDMPAKRRQDFIARTQAQVDRLNELVRDLLTLSRVESQATGALQRYPVDVRAPVAQSLQALNGAADAGHVSLDSHVPDSPTFVDGDEEIVRRIVDNLLDNAIKYTPAGGSVTLDVEHDDDRVTLQVTDTGTGIAPEHHTRIFERFYRVDESRTGSTGGTGLGLAIVKHCVTALDGRLQVRSAEGTGSTFRVELPASGHVVREPA